MKAFAIDGYQAALQPREMPDPVAGPGEVVVAVAAASVNPLDEKLREGAFKRVLPYRMPLVLGHDLAGTVVAVGPQTRRFKVGDEVFGCAGTGRIGSFAERIAVAETDLASKHATLGMAEAAALPLVSLAPLSDP
jgi:NADPH:quinone reductase-like Zn-dependent oxidoreductase